MDWSAQHRYKLLFVFFLNRASTSADCSICGYLEPLSVVLFCVLFLKEILQPIQVLGAILIIGGAVFAEGILKLKKYKITALRYLERPFFILPTQNKLRWQNY